MVISTPDDGLTASVPGTGERLRVTSKEEVAMTSRFMSLMILREKRYDGFAGSILVITTKFTAKVGCRKSGTEMGVSATDTRLKLPVSASTSAVHRAVKLALEVLEGSDMSPKTLILPSDGKASSLSVFSLSCGA